MLDEHQKRFVKLVEQLSYGKSRVLETFCELAALSLANSLQIKDADWDAREKRYQEVIKPYKAEELNIFSQMLACVVDSLSSDDGFNFHDCLGEMHMTEEITGRSKWDSDVAFTPKEVALTTAKMILCGLKMPEKGYITMAEPACGAGSMVIAACAAMKEMGFNFQKQLHVVATDIRAMLAHMAYVQLSLLHVPAIVIHGDSLAMKTWSVWKTPAHILGFWDARLRRDFVAPEQQIQEVIKVNRKLNQAAFSFK